MNIFRAHSKPLACNARKYKWISNTTAASFSREECTSRNWYHPEPPNALQHTATHCNTTQHTATYCNTLIIPLSHPVFARVAGFNRRTRDVLHVAAHEVHVDAVPVPRSHIIIEMKDPKNEVRLLVTLSFLHMPLAQLRSVVAGNSSCINDWTMRWLRLAGSLKL